MSKGRARSCPNKARRHRGSCTRTTRSTWWPGGSARWMTARWASGVSDLGGALFETLYGIIAPPGQTAYAASKFAVRGFSQAPRHEVEGTRAGITVPHPEGVAMSIAKNARAPEGASAEEIARGR